MAIENELEILKNISDRILRSEEVNSGFRNCLVQLEKEIKAIESHIKNSNNFEKDFLKVKDLRKLQIGGGKRTLEGFINVDIFQPADIVWDCRSGLPFKEDAFDFIFTEHFLEHVDYPVSALKIVNECYRVLSKSGELYISLPDAGKVIDAYNRDDKKYLTELNNECYVKRNPPVVINGNIDYVNYLFRDQIENTKYTIHHWAYDFESLRNILQRAGFSNVQRTTLIPEYCNPAREFYSLYIKAIK